MKAFTYLAFLAAAGSVMAAAASNNDVLSARVDTHPVSVDDMKKTLENVANMQKALWQSDGGQPQGQKLPTTADIQKMDPAKVWADISKIANQASQEATQIEVNVNEKVDFVPIGKKPPKDDPNDD